MYKLTKEIFDLLFETNRFGYICPYGALVGDHEWILEDDYDIDYETKSGDIEYKAEKPGCWLYHVDETKSGDLPMTMKTYDPNDKMVDYHEKDISMKDVCVVVPSLKENIPISIDDIERLFELEPEIEQMLEHFGLPDHMCDKKCPCQDRIDNPDFGECHLSNKYKRKLRKILGNECHTCGDNYKNNGSKLELHHRNYMFNIECNAIYNFRQMCDEHHDELHKNVKTYKNGG